MDHAINPIKVNPSDVAAIAALRRDIHAHPELGFQEERTADLIAKKLTDWGIPVHRGLGKTGVVGIVKNGNSDPRCRPARRYRRPADHRTQHIRSCERNITGKMHACGHDGHTAMLLAAASTSVQQPQFRRHGLPDFPACRRGRRRCARDDQGRTVRALPDGSDFRHSQLAGHGGGTVCAAIRAGVRIQQRVQDHHPRQGRARGDAAQRHRPGAGGLPDGAGLPDHHHAQQAADRCRCHLGHDDPCRRGDQRRARRLRTAGHGADLHASRCSTDRAAHAAGSPRPPARHSRRPANSHSSATTRRPSIIPRKPSSRASC